MCSASIGCLSFNVILLSSGPQVSHFVKTESSWKLRNFSLKRLVPKPPNLSAHEFDLRRCAKKLKLKQPFNNCRWALGCDIGNDIRSKTRAVIQVT